MSKNNDSFTSLTEDFLRDLIKEVKTNDKATLDDKMEMAGLMTKWVQIKNKVEPEGAEGSKIDEYRNALKGGSTTTSGTAVRRNTRGRAKTPDPASETEETESQESSKTESKRDIRTSQKNASGLSGNVPHLVNQNGAVSQSIGGHSDNAIIAGAIGLPRDRTFGGL